MSLPENEATISCRNCNAHSVWMYIDNSDRPAPEPMLAVSVWYQRKCRYDSYMWRRVGTVDDLFGKIHAVVCLNCGAVYDKTSMIYDWLMSMLANNKDNIWIR